MNPIIDVLNSPWAIIPEKLLEIQEIYTVHMRGDKIDVKAIEKRIGHPLNNDRENYVNDGGTAIIEVQGVIMKRANMFTQISGATSTQLLAKDFETAMADPSVHSIVLAVDSPGGSVDGTQAMADTVRAARDTGRKAIVAVADGMMASAAYWIGSAADKVYISGDTTSVGSIGVVAKHMDYSKAEEAAGVKVTEISAGKYKRVASQHEPLSQEGRQTLQDQVDHIYSVFVDAVAANRGVSTERVLSKMADGKLFIGKQAIDAGLVDGVSTIGAQVAKLYKKHDLEYRGAVAQVVSSYQSQI